MPRSTGTGTGTNASLHTIYLDCPFSEKDQAKSSGARWDESVKKWFVPPDLYPVIDRFNQWRPNAKVYLTCPFEQKDEARKSGAKWDRYLKRWYISVKGKAAIPTRFSKWLTTTSTAATTAAASPDPETPAKKTSTAKKVSHDKTKRGNSQDAALLRVNENMTVGQLKDECRVRNIKGLSSKNKEWLLQQLGIGTIWQTAAGSSTPASKLKPVEKVPTKPTPMKVTSTSKVAHKKMAAKSVKKIADKDKKTVAAQSAKKVADKDKKTVAAKSMKKVADKDKKVAAKSVASKLADLTRLPRVSSSLTAIQLTHELLHRHPNIKGTSNKPKSWFLGELGEGSIWATSPDLSRDLSNFALVSKNLTVAQLLHELMARSPSTKGLSNKSKNDLVKLAGIGSIWTTAGALNKETANSKTNNESPVSKTKKNAMESASKRKKPPVKMETSATTNTQMLSTVKNESTPKSATKVKKETPIKKSTTKKKQLLSATKVSTTKPAPKKPSNEKLVSTAKQASKTMNKRKTAAKRPPIIPSQAPSSSNYLAVPSNAKKPPVVPAQAVSSSTVAAASSAKRPSNDSKKDPLAKKIKLESIPVVSSHMTVAQLKVELKVRDPNIKGLSGKGKDWLISLLGHGTEVRGSTQCKAKANLEAAKLHSHQTLCHSHPLSASAALRAPEIWGLGLGTSKRRVHVGSCDVARHFICQQTPYRTCERCNYDICKACYEIESLPQHEKEQEAEKRLDEMAEQEAVLQRQWAEEERAREERRRQEEQRYKREREERLYEMHGDDLERFPGNIRNPSANHKDEASRFKYSVWTCDVHRKQDGGDVEKDFNSSYATLEEANLRVEYVFYYENPWGRDKEEMYADDDDKLVGGLRYLRSNPDGGGSLTVSVLPSEAFDLLQPRPQCHGLFDVQRGQQRQPLEENQFAKSVRNPPTKHTNEQKKLKYTVWKSCGYDHDGWHSYDGPSEKTFNSSYATLEEANERVEYVFYHHSPWGSRDEEFLYAETDEVTNQGFRFLECSPDDCERWTVSVIPSVAFDYINI